MGINFRKSISLGSGLKLNLSKSGPSISFGKSGLRQSVNLKGQTRTTVGIPGPGVYYTKTSSVGKIADFITGKSKKDDKSDSKKTGDKKGSSAKAASSAAAAKQEAANKKAAEKEAIAKQKQADAEAELQKAQETVAQYEEYVNAIKSVHTASDGKIDWQQVANGSVPADMVGLKNFAQRVLSGDTDAYLEVIGEFAPFDDLLDYGSNFIVGTDRADMLEIEFHIKADEVVPTTGFSVTAAGKLSEKELSKSAYYDLVQDYVASTLLRVARDSFALLPIDTVLVHACDDQLNPATGFDEEITYVSAKITRSQIEAINMERVDPSDALSNFECFMNFKKTTGFAPVDRVLP